jgi:hypothetical protein
MRSMQLQCSSLVGESADVEDVFIHMLLPSIVLGGCGKAFDFSMFAIFSSARCAPASCVLWSCSPHLSQVFAMAPSRKTKRLSEVKAECESDQDEQSSEARHVLLLTCVKQSANVVALKCRQ